MEASVSFANESTDEMAKEAIQTGLEMPENIIVQSTPQSNLRFKTAADSKKEIEVYLKKLFEFNPATIGGSMPDDDFYYFAN